MLSRRLSLCLQQKQGETEIRVCYAAADAEWERQRLGLFEEEVDAFG
jgi:hypothetical protein